MENKINNILDAISATRGEDVVIYDSSMNNPFVDRIVIVSADNMRQVFALANNIHDKLKENGYECRVEGNKDSKWILLDAKDVVIHVFYDEERSVYKLERLYSEYPRVDVNSL